MPENAGAKSEATTLRDNLHPSCSEQKNMDSGSLFRYQNYITWVPGKVSKMGEVGPTFIVKNMALPVSGQSHLILGTGSASHVITRQFSKLYCIRALYKPLENLDAIALLPVFDIPTKTHL
jgi:hypothetical protein